MSSTRSYLPLVVTLELESWFRFDLDDTECMFRIATALAADRPRADAARNRSRVIAAATEVFVSQGGDASMAAVARGAGVGVGTVYRHFADKQALLEAVLVAELDRLEADVRGCLSGPDPGAELAGFLRGVAARGRVNAAVKDALAAGGVDVRAATKTAARGLRGALGELLAWLQARA